MEKSQDMFWDHVDRACKDRKFLVTFRGSGRILVKLMDYEVVSFSVKVYKDRTWTVKLFGVVLSPVLSVFSLVPKVLDTRGLSDLLDILNNCQLCPGNPDFDDVCRSEAPSTAAVFTCNSGEVIAKEIFTTQSSSVRHTHCQMIIPLKASRCELCRTVRSRLSSLRARVNSSSIPV